MHVLLGNGDGSFQEPRDFAVGTSSWDVAIADFDADGAADLAVTDLGGQTLNILRGNGDGTFQPAVSYPTPSFPFSVVAGDFDADGAIDLALTNSNTNNVSVFRGIGDATFAPAVNYSVGTHPVSATTGDVNGDGALDLVTANSDGDNVSVLPGRGDGTFQPRVNYAAGPDASSVTAGDWNGDGDLDLAVTNKTSNTVRVLVGAEDGTFRPGGIFALGYGPAAMVTGDWDGDGHLDLAVADAGQGLSADVSVLVGYGDGTFAAPRSYGVALHPGGVEVGDFNEDGVPDLAIATYHGDCVSVLLGRSDGTFQTAANYATGNFTHALVVGDFNADGHLDLAVTGLRLDVLLGRGDGTFGPTTFYLAVPTSSDSVVAADFDGDGALDIALTVYYSDSPSVVAVLMGNGDGTFQPASYFNAGIGSYSVAAGDFDEDGDIDLVVTNVYGRAADKLYVLLGNGDGSFQTPVPYGLVSVGRSVVVADFDGDAHVDLAVANADSLNGTTGVSVILGNGDGTFQAAVDYPVDYEAWDVAAGDFDADGVLDLVLANPQSNSVSVFRGQGDGTFLAPARYTAGLGPRSVAVGDFNGDGFPDLAQANWDANFATVLLNAGSTTTVTINQWGGQADPTAGSTIAFDVVFKEPVTGFDAADIDLSASTVGGTLVPAVTGSGSTYMATVTGMTGPGTVVAVISAGAAIDGWGMPTLASTSTDNTVTFNNVPPTVTIEQGASQLDPTNSSPITFDVHFSQAVTGFDGSDVLFTGSTVAGTLVAGVSGVAQDYTVTVMGMSGTGAVVAIIPAGAAVNDLGTANAASSSTDNTVSFDGDPPTVTINQAPGHPDPTNVASVQFDVKFSEPVTGFDAADVSLAGSTTGGTLSIDVTGSLDTYLVTVTGMTTSGSIIATIPAAAAIDAAGNGNLASTCTDNLVEFLNAGILGFAQAIYHTAEDASTVTITVTRTGETDGAVSIQYGTGAGTAHAGSDYTTTFGTLSWADGESGDKTFTIPILPDDLNEGKEVINLALTNPVGNPDLGLTTATVAIAPSDGQGPGVYYDQDGDKYSIKLTGKTGSLLYYRTDPDGDGRGPIELIELTDTLPDPLKPKASLVITVAKSRTSTDGGTVGLGAITGSGLKSISARRANLDGDGINLNGYLGALVIGNITNGADITTLATTNPKQKTRINALAIGDDSAIQVGASVSSLVATSFGASSFNAPSVGLFRVTGAVTGADIEVDGNVGAVVVGAFRTSRLFAGYTGPDIPDPAGFNFAATVTTFRCTAKIDGFANSRVIASNFKTVTIANLNPDNPASKFGFYANESLGAITVKGPTKFKYNAALPTPQGIGDFKVEIV